MGAGREMVDKMLGSVAKPVTYPVLATILCTAGAFLAWVLTTHSTAGHDRHDRQAERAITTKEFDAHTSSEEKQINLMIDGQKRMERKFDWLLERAGVGFPPEEGSESVREDENRMPIRRQPSRQFLPRK